MTGLRLRWTVVMTLVGAAVAALVSWQQPRTYRAECLLDYGREPGSGSAPVLSDEWYRTQDYILTSHQNVERAVMALKLDRERSFTGLSNPSAPAVQNAIVALRRRLTLSEVEGTHAVRLGVDDPQPAKAARIANALAEAYLARALEDQAAAATRAAQWLAEELEVSTRRLAQSEGELEAYLGRADALAVPPHERQKKIVAELEELQKKLTAVRLERIELTARHAKLKAASQLPNPFDAHTSELDAAPMAQQLRADYLHLLIKQKELAVSDSSAVPAAQARLDALWSGMQMLVQGVASGVHAELVAIQQVEAQVQQALGHAEAEGRALQRDALEYHRLERDHSEAENVLRGLRERISSGGLATLVNGHGAQLLERASPPERPQTPAVARSAAIGALCGVLLSSLLSWLLRSFRVPEGARRKRTSAPQAP